MVASPKGLGPEKDCAGNGQQHVQMTDPSFHQRGRPTKKQDRDCQTVISGHERLTDSLSHRQSQCDFDFDFEFDV
jgi:hypothetical protein